jgi:hypothetical protein
MIVLRIEHPVPDFDAWKRTFDSDPARREEGGVRAYRVIRPVNDPNFATVDLEFDERATAEAFLDRLKDLWRTAEGKVMRAPQTKLLEVLEQVTY